MRVVVGRIGRPHGIRGQVTVECRTDEPDVRFAPGAQLLTETSSLTVESSQWHSGRLLVQFAGVTDRNEAEHLRDTIVSIDRDPAQMPEESDEYYDSALIECQVMTDDGTVVGTVSEVLHLPGQDLLVVTAGDAEFLIPFVEAIVPTVDVANRSIVITPPDGLLE